MLLDTKSYHIFLVYIVHNPTLSINKENKYNFSNTKLQSASLNQITELKHNVREGHQCTWFTPNQGLRPPKLFVFLLNIHQKRYKSVYLILKYFS